MRPLKKYGHLRIRDQSCETISVVIWIRTVVIDLCDTCENEVLRTSANGIPQERATYQKAMQSRVNIYFEFPVNPHS